MSIFVKTKVDVTCKWPSLHAHREMQVEKVVQHQFRLGLFKIKILKQSLCLSIKLAVHNVDEEWLHYLYSYLHKCLPVRQR